MKGKIDEMIAEQYFVVNPFSEKGLYCCDFGVAVICRARLLAEKENWFSETISILLETGNDFRVFIAGTSLLGGSVKVLLRMSPIRIASC